MTWISTKSGYVNIDKYSDLFVGKTSAKQFVIKAEDYQTGVIREIDLGIFNTRDEAEEMLYNNLRGLIS